MGGRGVISMVWEGRNLICAVSPWLLYNHQETTRNEINAAENQLQAPKKHHGLRTPTHFASEAKGQELASPSVAL